MITLNVNGTKRQVDADPETPLLWVLRDNLGITSVKYTCGIAECGACIVLVDGQPVRSCITPLASVTDKQITTIEGLSADRSHPVQQAWAELDVPQCGYCQPGIIMTAAALLNSNPNPSDADIDSNLTNICRCGTFNRVRRGIHLAAQLNKRGRT